MGGRKVMKWARGGLLGTMNSGQWAEMFDVADHHFVGSLRAPANGLGGVRVGTVGVAIVEDGGQLENGALAEQARFEPFVTELPVEIIPGQVR